MKEIYQPFLKNIETGEIFYDGNPTGDIGLKYNGNLYVLYRKGNFDSLLKNHFKETLKIDCQIQVINGKKYVIFDDCMDVSKLAHIYMYFCYNIKIMKVLNIETIPLFAKLNRSKGLRKIIKLNEKCELKKFEHDEKCIYLENKLNECIEFDEGFSGSPDFPGIIVKKDNKSLQYFTFYSWCSFTCKKDNY